MFSLPLASRLLNAGECNVEFFLVVILGFAVAFLWRRTDALQAQIAYLEQSLEGMRHRIQARAAAHLQDEQRELKRAKLTVEGA